MSTSKYSESRRYSSSVENIPDPNNTALEVVSIAPPSLNIKNELKEMPDISTTLTTTTATNANNGNNINCNNRHSSRYATNSQYCSYTNQRSRQESFSPDNNQQTRSASPLRHQRDYSVSFRAPRPSRWDRSPSPHSYQRGRSPTPRAYQRGRSPSPYSYQRGRSPTPRLRQRDRSLSPIQYRRYYSRSPNQRQWAYSRSPSQHQWYYSRSPSPNSRHYTPSPPPCRFTRPPISRRHDRPSRWERSSSYRYDRSPSPYYRRRSFSRSNYNSFSPPYQRGRSPTVIRSQRKSLSPVYGYNCGTSARVASPPPSPLPAPQSPIYMPSSSSSSRLSSRLPSVYGSVPSRLPESRSPQPAYYRSSSNYRRRSLSPRRESTRRTRADSSDNRNRRSLSRSSYTREATQTPLQAEYIPLQGASLDLVGILRGRNIERPTGPFQDYIPDITSNSGEDDQVLPDCSTYRTSANRRTTYVPPLSDTTNLFGTGRKTRLPSHWKVKMTNDGDIYYFNLITQEQRSTRPIV